VKRELLLSLFYNGDYTAAERLGYETLGTLSAHDPEPQTAVWLRESLAEVLLRQGKLEQAKAVMQPLLSQQRHGDLDISGPTLNYSDALLKGSYSREALDVASTVAGFVSPFGELVMKRVQACAMVKLGRKPEANAIFAGILKSAEATDSKRGFNNVISAALCLDRLTPRAIRD
jgi:Tetratricopeptide repeat